MKKITLAKTLAVTLVLGLTQACSTQAPKPTPVAAEPAPQAVTPATPAAPATKPEAKTAPKEKCPMDTGKMTPEMKAKHAKACAKAKSHQHCEEMAKGEKCPHMQEEADKGAKKKK